MKRYCILFSLISGFAYGEPEINIAIKSGDWNSSKVWNQETLPSEGQKVWVDQDKSLLLRDSAEIYQLALGDGDRSGTLIIDGGSLKTLSTQWSAVGYNSSSVLKIVNGGSLISEGRLAIGLKDDIHQSVSEMVVEEGHVEVNGMLEMGKNFDGVSDNGKQVASVAILRIVNGSVEVEDISINIIGHCRVNLCGGSLVIDGDKRATIEEYISDGRVFAHSKATGARVLVDYADGKTIVSAEESPKPLGLVLAGR